MNTHPLTKKAALVEPGPLQLPKPETWQGRDANRDMLLTHLAEEHDLMDQIMARRPTDEELVEQHEALHDDPVGYGRDPHNVMRRITVNELTKIQRHRTTYAAQQEDVKLLEGLTDDLLDQAIAMGNNPNTRRARNPWVDIERIAQNLSSLLGLTRGADIDHGVLRRTVEKRVTAGAVMKERGHLRNRNHWGYSTPTVVSEAELRQHRLEEWIAAETAKINVVQGSGDGPTYLVKYDGITTATFRSVAGADFTRAQAYYYADQLRKARIQAFETEGTS